MNNIEEIMEAIFIGLVVATFLLNTGRVLNAIELCKESLVLQNNVNIGPSIKKQICQKFYGAIRKIMFKGYRRISDNTNAITWGRKLLAICRECGDTGQEGMISMALAKVYLTQSMYVEAKELYERANIIMREIGNRAGEASSYGSLGTVFQFLGQYVKAKEYHEKALALNMEMGDRDGEAVRYGNLGTVLQSLGEYIKAKEYHEKSLAITMEIGDRKGEATCYGNLGTVFRTLGEYVKAKEYHEKALAIKMETGDRAKEATCYLNLGTVFQSLGQSVKAKEYYEKALVITKKLGDKAGEARSYGKIGMVFKSLGQYVKAKDYYDKALVITKKLCHKEGEARNYGNMGSLFHALGEYVQAKEYFEKALNIRMEIGDRPGEAEVYANLGVLSLSLRKYSNSKEYYDKALAILSKTGGKAEEATVYGNLGVLFHFLGDNVKAKEHFEKSLAITLQIGDKRGEASNYHHLGCVFQSRGEYVMAEEYFEKALSRSKNCRCVEIELQCYLCLTLTKLSQKKVREASSYLCQSIKKCENLRDVNAGSDHIKISIADMHVFPAYLLLSKLLCVKGNTRIALVAAELGRARALADLMTTQYSVEKHISADPQSRNGIENFIKKESACTCLYISYLSQEVFLWLLEKSGAIHFRNITVDEKTLHTRLAKVAINLDEFFAIMAESFRSFGILPDEVCEDRSLNDIEPKLESCQEEGLERLRRGKDKDDPEPSLRLFYEILINPVSDLLDEPEVLIVPDRGLYRVPFPALLNESGKYLSETFRIRIAPSLTTLKLIQDSPADFHSQTGALVVGDPDVGEVIYSGSVNKKFIPLPGARKEAEMIGQLLGVEPLLGQHATKQAVLQRINSVSLIHIAAHGNAVRGEIALAPSGLTTETPQEDDYLLKMSNISQVQVRAKLVVLSCCHSGRGQIRAEVVVGIARAFLGSGARSVLVALWALEDRATEQSMSRFYEHLVRGVSVSECLHEAMKWMRENGFSKVQEWAPFMLIGDNVSFAFPKKVSSRKIKAIHVSNYVGSLWELNQTKYDLIFHCK